MTSFRLNRNEFKAQTAGEAANHRKFYLHLSWQERAKIAHYLIRAAYNISDGNFPKMDKHHFTAHSREK